MAGLGPLDAIALAAFLLAWVGYHQAVERSRYSGSSLNMRMNERRHAWMREMAARENRIVDAQIMGSLQSGTAFFASTALLAVGGVLALLQSTEQVFRLFDDLPFAAAPSRAAWELKVAGLAVIFAYAFFKFAWSYRLFNYAAMLLGAVPRPGEGERVLLAAREAGGMIIAAGRHFARGQRAFFFAIAYLGWFLGPAPFLAATLAVLVAMWNRQFKSDAYRAVAGGQEASGQEASGQVAGARVAGAKEADGLDGPPLQAASAPDDKPA